MLGFHCKAHREGVRCTSSKAHPVRRARKWYPTTAVRVVPPRPPSSPHPPWSAAAGAGLGRREDVRRARRAVGARDAGRGRDGRGASCRRPSTSRCSDRPLAFRVYRHGCLVAENAAAPEGTTLRDAELVDGQGRHVGRLRPRVDARADQPRRPGRLPAAGGRRSARRADAARPADDDRGQQPGARCTTSTSRMADRIRDALTVPLDPPARRVLQLLADRPGDGGRGGRPRRRRGLPGLLPARAADPARDRARRPGAGGATARATRRASSACTCARTTTRASATSCAAAACGAASGCCRRRTSAALEPSTRRTAATPGRLGARFPGVRRPLGRGQRQGLGPGDLRVQRPRPAARDGLPEPATS